jgi:hypothetical protein
MTHPGERRKAATAAMATSPSSSSAGLLRKLNSYPRKVEIGQESKHVSEWVAWCVKTRKTRRAIETLEQLISISEALIIDDDLVEVLRFIARWEWLNLNHLDPVGVEFARGCCSGSNRKRTQDGYSAS